MALSTYAELKTSIAAWMKPNTSLPAAETALIADYITLAEAEINRVLDAPEMEATESLTITSGVATAPTGMRKVIALQLTQSPFNRLDLVDVDPVAASTGYASGTPTHYRRSGTSLLFFPPTSATASIRFRKGVTALSDLNTSNWLLASHPDIYLYGSVIQADTRFIDETQLTLCQARYDRALNQLNQQNAMQHSGRIRIQPSGAVV